MVLPLTSTTLTYLMPRSITDRPESPVRTITVTNATFPYNPIREIVPPVPEVRSIYNDRLTILKQRSEMEWGEAPNYNESYRSIRWPSRSVPNGTGGTHFSKPDWKKFLLENISKKTAGNWNNVIYNRRNNDILPGIGRNRVGDLRYLDTRTHLRLDLFKCMSNNIPFKTKTLFYNPRDTTLYICDVPVVKYDIESGLIVSFSYCGVYNKRISLMLRMIGINVITKNRKLIHAKVVSTEYNTTGTRLIRRPEVGWLFTPIELNKIYYTRPLEVTIIVDPVMYNEHYRMQRAMNIE